LPFLITITAILVTDLLQGVVIGIAIGLVFVMRSNYHKSITLQQDKEHQTLLLNKDVSFLSKALLRSLLHKVEKNSTLVIDASKAQFIDLLLFGDRDTMQEIIARAAIYHHKPMSIHATTPIKSHPVI
jgi:MFS superfamily sulfate permease-like transporter